jgi:hypothetical protein
LNRKKLFGLLAITIVVASIGTVAAYRGKLSGIDPQDRNNITNITNAIKANDFNAWKEAMTAQLTVDNFNKLVKRYQIMSKMHGK